MKKYIIGVSEGGEKDIDLGFPASDKGYRVRDIIRSMNSSEKSIKTTSVYVTVPKPKKQKKT